MNLLKRLLAVPGNGILNAALEEVRVVLHTEGIAIRRPIRLKHVLDFALLDLGRARAAVHVESGLVLARDRVLLHAAAEERLHVVMLVVLGGNALPGQGTYHILSVHIDGILLHAVIAELHLGLVVLGSHGIGIEIAG